MLHEHIIVERAWSYLYMYTGDQGNNCHSERCHQAAICVQGPSRHACIGGGITTPGYLATLQCSTSLLLRRWSVAPATDVFWEVRGEGPWDTDRFAHCRRS